MGRHCIAAEIPGFEGSYGLLSPDPLTGVAIIFVHGFWGDSYSTWQDIQVLVDEFGDRFPLFSESDLFFLEYDAAGNFVGPSADKLRRFVDLLFPTPPGDLFSEDITTSDWGSHLPFSRLCIRPGPYLYNSLILVGHSLGAVVIRQMILDAATDFSAACQLTPTKEQQLLSQRPVLLADIRLMSPAHLGFRPVGALGAAFALSPMAGLLRGLLTFYRSFTELDPDSELLQSLRRRTEEMSRSFPGLPALCAKSLCAENDDVVIMDRYDCDRRIQYVSDRTHTTVCKPLRTYLTPLEFIGQYGQSYERVRRA
jgi:pimeloyl-ACP methyl ester carboxylesterase